MPEKEIEVYDLEKVYDEEISPLMQQIIEICRREKMPMFATFCFRHDPEHPDGEFGMCTTNMLFDRAPESMYRLHGTALSAPRFSAFAITVASDHKEADHA